MITDARLLEEIQQGDKQAFSVLYQRYAPRLLRYACHFIPDQASAQDIVQECFIHFWEKKALLQSLSINALLFAMTRNACLNYLKHRQLIEEESIDYLLVMGGVMKNACTTPISNTIRKQLFYTKNYKSKSKPPCKNCPNAAGKFSY